MLTKQKFKSILGKSTNQKNKKWIPEDKIKVTMIHGFVQCTKGNGSNYKLWRSIMFINFILTIGFMFIVKQTFNADHVVTKIYSDTKVNSAPFPAVSICNFNKVSWKESRSIAKLLKNYNISNTEIDDFFKNIPKLNKYYVSKSEVKNFTRIMSILKNRHFYDMETIMEDITQKCENLLIYCDFNKKPKKCDNLFKLTQTYDGHCCTFNYEALREDTDTSNSNDYDPDFEYLVDHINDDHYVPTNVITNSQAGRTSGLRVVFDVDPEDYPPFATVRSYGAKILISDPTDYPEITVKYRYISLGESVDIKVSPIIYQSDFYMRRISPQIRGCWFHDEVKLTFTNKYSFETCMTECKMRTYKERCGCIPYKYPSDKSTRHCEFEDLLCLSDVNAYWSTLEEPCDPPCLLECRDRSFDIASDTVPFLVEYYPQNILDGRNLSQISAVAVYFSETTCTCYKLSLVMDLVYFIGTYGGIFSLTFGGSLMTLFELLYILLACIGRVLYNFVFSRYCKKIMLK